MLLLQAMQIITFILLLHLCAKVGTAYHNSGHDCYIKDGYTSPYVTALQHELAAQKGCVTDQRTPTSKHEVHVIRVDSSHHGNQRSRDKRSSRDGQNRSNKRNRQRTESVTLHVSPHEGIERFDGTVVVVLWSRKAVIWQIDAHPAISNSTRFIFMLPKSSRIKDHDNLAVGVKIKKFSDMPDRLEQLETWTRAETGAVTSLSQVSSASSVLLTIGTDPEASEECEMASYSPGVSMHTAALSVVYSKQDTMACAARWNQGYEGKDVHIIEVHSTPSMPTPGDVPGHILLVIKAKSAMARARHLLLVLKAPSTARWTVDISRFKGNLDIITNVDVVNRGSSRQMVMVTLEPLQDTGQNLMNWVADSYGHPVSYTDTQAADKFMLYVDGGENLPLMIPGLNSQHAPQLPNNNQPSTWPQPSESKQRFILQKTHQVVCTDRTLTVILPKHLLQNSGIERKDLSFLDQRCGATDNSTHLILDTDFTKCGTQQTSRNSMSLYTNKVVLRVPGSHTPRDTNPAASSQGQGHLDEFLEGSGSGYGLNGDDTFVDDEDLHGNNAVWIDVSCEVPSYPTPNYASKMHRTHTIAEVKFSLNLFRDADFTRPIHKKDHFAITQGSTAITQGSTVYVEANVTTREPRLRPMLKQCMVSPSTHPGENSHTLIDKGCRRDNTLLFLSDGPGREKRFSFQLYSVGKDDSLSHIMCELAVCTDSQDAELQDIPKCVSQDQYCLMINMDPSDSPSDINPLINAHTQLVVAPPLVVIKPLPPGHNTNPGKGGEVPVIPTESPRVDPSPDSSPEDACETIVRVEGLDSGTVVGIAFAAFVIGVLLTGALWYIHTHTGPMSRRNNRPRSAETSGESTPSSTAPITIHQIHRFNPPMTLLNALPVTLCHAALRPRIQTSCTAVHQYILLPMFEKYYEFD